MILTRISRQRKERMALWVGASAGALVIGIVLVASVTIQNGLPGNKGAELKLQFANVGHVNRFDDVRIAGRRVGGVASVTYRDGHATVLVRLQEGLEGLRESTIARTRLAGLIGAQYVELVPGRRGRPLRDGATIPMSRTSTSPDVFAALTAFDDERVDDLRSMTRALGAGLADRGDGANRAFATAPHLLAEADPLLDALGSDRGALRRLFPAAASMAAALEPVTEEMAAGFEEGERSLRPFADHDDSVAALLRESAGAVRETPVELPRHEPLMRETERLTKAVTRFTADAPGTLRKATSLLRASPRPLRATVPMMQRFRAAVPPVLSLLEATSPLVTPFRRSLESALPPIREVARRVCDLDESIPWMRGVPAFGTPARHELGADNLIRVLSGGDGTTGEALGPDYDRYKPSRHDEDPPLCGAAEQVVE